MNDIFEIRFNHHFYAWYFNGRLHREDGPAIICKDGSRSWYFNGRLHRTDGPAIEWSNGCSWWIDGCELTEDEFNHYVHPDCEFMINGKSVTREDFFTFNIDEM